MARLEVRVLKVSVFLIGCTLASVRNVPAMAQLFDSQHPAQQQIALSASEKATLDRLNSLQTLPDSPWHVHAGHVAHGESPRLDDSTWAVVPGQVESRQGSSLLPAHDRDPEGPTWLRPDRGPISAFDFAPMPMARCQRFCSSTADAWHLATISNRHSFSPKPHPVTRYSSQSSCCRLSTTRRLTMLSGCT
jgi:hypothetical protein